MPRLLDVLTWALLALGLLGLVAAFRALTVFLAFGAGLAIAGAVELIQAWAGLPISRVLSP